MYPEFILFIVYGFILLFNFNLLLIYSRPNILFDEFNIFKSFYFTSMNIRGIFGDFTVSKTVTDKRSFELLKNGLVIANIDEKNKFTDNHLSIRIN